MDSNTFTIEKLLTDLFLLKFSHKGEDLILAIESFDWKPFDNINPKDVFTYLKSIQETPTPEGKFIQQVPIEFLLDDNNEPIFSVNSLKASACLSWEVDIRYIRSFFSIVALHHVVIQTAQASHYGSFEASHQLQTIATTYDNLDSTHPLYQIKHRPKHETYNFPILFDKEPDLDLSGKSYGFSGMSTKEFTTLWDKFYKVELYGLFEARELELQRELKKEEKQEEEEEEESNDEREKRTKSIDSKSYKILIVNEKPKDMLIWRLLRRNIYGITKTFYNLSGLCETSKKIIKLEFFTLNHIPEPTLDNPDGIIFADCQENPEEIIENLEREFGTKAFLFCRTPEPSTKNSIACYLRATEEDKLTDEDDELFENFIEALL